MKHLILYLLPFVFIQHVLGQVSGTITEANGQPIPFATVTLMQSRDSTLIRSALTDDKGMFKLEQVPADNYLLRVSSTGFITWYSPGFDLTRGQGSKDFGTQTLQASSRALGEVLIRADRPAVQQVTGGLAVNVQNSILTKGSSVLEVLQRSPGVTLDQRNNSLILNGKNGVMVMMDGKLMRMSMAQVIAMLNGISADNIEKIELLDTPPAKYDADGNAGLINIVTKKSRRTGTNGSVTLSAGYGKHEKASAAISLNHNTPNTGFYTSYSFSHDHSYYRLFAHGTENVGAIGGQTEGTYLGVGHPASDYHNAIAGFDTKLSSHITIGSSINYTNSTDGADNINKGSYLLKPDSVLLFNSKIKGAGHGQNITGNFNIANEISKDEKISFDADYIYYRLNGLVDVLSSFVDNHGNGAGGNDSLYAPRQRDFSNTTIKVGVAKIDYGLSLGRNLKLEAGAKGTYTNSNSSSGIEKLAGGTWVSSLSASSKLNITEGIAAGYTTLTARIDTFTSLIAGARYEYSNNTATGFDRKLGMLFPSIFLTRKLNNKGELQLSYTKRITRPSYRDLANYIAYNDPVSVFTGNPALKPAITSNLKLGYSYHNYIFSILFSRDDNPIALNQLTTGPLDIVYISPQNITYNNNITLQAHLPFKVGDWWEMNYDLSGRFRKYRIDYTPQPFEKSWYGYSANFTETFKLKNSLSVEVSGQYNSSSYYGTSLILSSGAINTGIKKELNNNKGSFQLSVSDVLTNINYSSYVGKAGRDAFNTNFYVNYSPESRSIPIFKLTYYRSFGTTGNKAQLKYGTDSKEEQDRIRRN